MKKFVAFLFIIGVAIATKSPIEQKIKEVKSKFSKQLNEYSVASSSNSIQERQTGTPTYLVNGQTATGTLNPLGAIDFIFSYDNSSIVPVQILVTTSGDATFAFGVPPTTVPTYPVPIRAGAPFNETLSISCTNVYYFRISASAVGINYAITATAAPGTNYLTIGGPTLIQRSAFSGRAIFTIAPTLPCSNFTIVMGNFPLGGSNYLNVQPFCDPYTFNGCPLSQNIEVSSTFTSTFDTVNLMVTCAPMGNLYIFASTFGDFDIKAVSGIGCQNCPADKGICKIDGTCSCFQPYSGPTCSTNTAEPVPDVGTLAPTFNVYHSFQAPTLTTDNLIISVNIDSGAQVGVVITIGGASPDVDAIRPLFRDYVYSSFSYEVCSGMASNSLFIIRLDTSIPVNYEVNVTYVNRVVSSFPFSYSGLNAPSDPQVQFFKLANIPAAFRAGLTTSGPIQQPEGVAIVSANECAFLSSSYQYQNPRRYDFNRHRTTFAVADSCVSDTELYVAVMSKSPSYTLLINNGIGNCLLNCNGRGFCLDDNTCQCHKEFTGPDCGLVNAPIISLNENVSDIGYSNQEDIFYALEPIIDGWEYLKLNGNFGQFGSAQLVPDPYDDDSDSAVLQETGSDFICSYAKGVSRPNNWWVRLRTNSNFNFTVSKATPVILTSGNWFNYTTTTGDAILLRLPLTNSQSATVTIQATESLTLRTAADGSCSNYRSLQSNGVNTWNIPTCRSNWGGYLYKIYANVYPSSTPMTVSMKVDVVNSAPGCPNCCSGKGLCDGTSCICSPGWQGADCSQPTCISNLATCGDGYPKTLIPLFVPNDYDENGGSAFWTKCSISDLDASLAQAFTEVSGQCSTAVRNAYCQTYFPYCVSTNVYGIKCDYCSQLTSGCTACNANVNANSFCNEIDNAITLTELNFTCFNSSRPLSTGSITTGQGITTGRATTGRITTGLITTGQPACTRICGANQTCVYVYGSQICQCNSPLIQDPNNPARCKSSCSTNPQSCGQNSYCAGDDCVCYNGYQRNINTGLCELIPPPPQSSASCSFFGDPHFNGFGGFPYDYQGGCDYIAVQGGNLEVQARFEFCNSQQTISCAAAIAVWIKDVNVTVAVRIPNEIWVNDVPTTVSTTLSLAGGNSIQRNDAYQVTINLADGSIIRCQYYYYTIIIPRLNYYQAVNGLCGRWDSDTPNLLHHRDGNVTNYATLPSSWSPLVSAFGDSWIVAQSRGDRYLFEPLGAPRCPAKKRQQSNPCGQNVLAWARDQCGVLLQNPSCTAINLNAYYETCVFDVCTTESLEWVDVARNAIVGSCTWYTNATATDTTGSITTGQAPPPEVSEASFITAFYSIILFVWAML